LPRGDGALFGGGSPPPVAPASPHGDGTRTSRNGDEDAAGRGRGAPCTRHAILPATLCVNGGSAEVRGGWGGGAEGGWEGSGATAMCKSVASAAARAPARPLQAGGVPPVAAPVETWAAAPAAGGRQRHRRARGAPRPARRLRWWTYLRSMARSHGSAANAVWNGVCGRGGRASVAAQTLPRGGGSRRRAGRTPPGRAPVAVRLAGAGVPTRLAGRRGSRRIE